jgi:hypothetical protein
MIRMSCACVVLACLSVAGYGEPPAAPLHKEQLKFDGLKAWRTRTYSMTYCKPGGAAADEQTVGRMSFACESRDGLIKLTTVARMYLPDGKRFIEYRGESLHPATGLFSTKEVHLHASRSDGAVLQDLKATVDGEEVTVVTEENGKSSTVEGKWSPNAVVDTAMFYLVTLVPRQADRRYLVESYVDSSNFPRPKPRILECDGPDRRGAASAKPWTLFLLYEPDNRAKAVRYWVSEDGLLRRVQLSPENRLELMPDEKDRNSKK